MGRTAASDEPRQAHCPSVNQWHRETPVEDAKLSRLVANAQVAPRCKLESASDTEPANRRNDRFVQLQDHHLSVVFVSLVVLSSRANLKPSRTQRSVRRVRRNIVVHALPSRPRHPRSAAKSDAPRIPAHFQVGAGAEMRPITNQHRHARPVAACKVRKRTPQPFGCVLVDGIPHMRTAAAHEHVCDGVGWCVRVCLAVCLSLLLSIRLPDTCLSLFARTSTPHAIQPHRDRPPSRTPVHRPPHAPAHTHALAVPAAASAPPTRRQAHGHVTIS
jgi:hypothetical protein